MCLKHFAVFAMLATLVTAAGPISAQSLADLARKEEERRKKLPDPAKVYTNKDLTAPPSSSTPPAPAPAAVPATDASKGDAAKAKEAEAKDKGPAKDQAYWA